MAPIRPSGQKPSLGNVLVIGGCGFLGHHIVAQIISNWGASKVSVIDVRTDRNRRPESDKVAYYDGDITQVSSLLDIFTKAKPDIVIHTASPLAVADASQKTKDLFYKVNVEGTKAVIEACQTKGVKVLVYTSSASVVSDNVSDLVNVDERWPVVPPKFQTEYYSQTKAEAESLVLAANRASPSPSLLTTSIRPAGIFGEGDVQLIPNMYNAYKEGKTNFQLGDNKNLFDFTYVGNVAHAHLLAANALLQTSSMATTPLDHEKVDGEVFFITNDEPVPFWDFARGVWKAAGMTEGTEKVWVIPKDVGIAIGTLLEWVMWGLGRTPKLTIRQVKFSCMTRYYDCKKAKQRLGYKPLVGLWDGIQKGVEWTKEQEAKGIVLKK